MATDDGLLIKPEPRKPWVVVAVAAGVLAVLAGGYVASGLSGKPKPAATATAASPAPVTANPDQLPAIIIAVLPLAADAGATAAPAAGDASQHLVDARAILAAAVPPGELVGGREGLTEDFEHLRWFDLPATALAASGTVVA